MAKGHVRRRTSRQAHECEHSSKFQRAAESFDNNRLRTVLQFLVVVREVIDHLMLDQCGECQTNLVRGYQFPEGCINPPLGHKVTLYSGILADHSSISMTCALNYIEIEHRDLAHVVRHVRNCVSCATAVAEYREGA